MSFSGVLRLKPEEEEKTYPIFLIFFFKLKKKMSLPISYFILGVEMKKKPINLKWYK